MKTNKIVDEAQYMLTEETRNDKALQPIDLNVLAVCQYVANYKQLDYDKDGWFILPIGERDKIKATSIQGYLSKWGVKVSEDTVRRSVIKLAYLKYLEYKKGYYYNSNQSQLPEIKILKGTIPMLMGCSDGSDCSVSGDCDGIAVATDTYINTDTYTETETESKTKKEKEKTYSISTSVGSSCEVVQDITSVDSTGAVSSSLIEEEMSNGSHDYLDDYISDPIQRKNVISWAVYVDEPDASVFKKLVLGYRYGRIDSLPLLIYMQEHLNDDVYHTIYREFKENAEDIECLNILCKNLGFTPTMEEETL